jgi:pimeloyl-ACP methyl ester carboxylesterase
MNTLSIRDLCCLFCCPPFPSRIAAKLAFLPPEPTYSLHVVDSHTPINGIIDEKISSTKKSQADSDIPIRYSIKFSDKAEWQHSHSDITKLEPYFVTTSRHNRIACLYINCTSNPKYHILFSHGNAVDLGQMASFFIVLGTRLQCNIISYDYSGYGASHGKASEKNMYADIEATYNSLKQRYHISDSKIILYGQSIGTVPTIDLASRHSECCIACILHSPLTSGMRVAFPDTKRTWCCDAFPSIDKIHRIRSIVLIIHGTEDDVIDVSHGFALYNRIHIQHQIEPLWLDGAGHNDIEAHGQYVERLLRLIDLDIPQICLKKQQEQQPTSQQQSLASSPPPVPATLASTLIIPASTTNKTN